MKGGEGGRKINIKRNDIREALVNLYLRLNGYLTSGFIIHASNEDNPSRGARAEIDLLGVRFPFHSEEERNVPPSDILEVAGENIDIIIGEVKGENRPVKFNDTLFNFENIAYILRWLGISSNSEEINLLSNTIAQEIQHLPIDNYHEYSFGPNIRLRPIIFHLDDNPVEGVTTKFVGHDEIMNFIFTCLRLDKQPEQCRRRYNYGLWGPITEYIIRYFKQDQEEAGTLNNIYLYIEEK